MGLGYAAAVLIGGGRLKFHVEQAVQIRRFGLVHDGHGVVGAVGFQCGGGGIGGQFGGYLLVDLRYGQAHPHGFVLVDGDVDLLVAVLLAVAGVGNAVHAVQQVDHLLGGSVQIVQVAAVQVDLDTAAGKCAHVHHAVGIHGHFAGQGGGGIGDLFLNFAAPAGTLIGQQYIIGKGCVVHGGITAHHGHHAVAAGHGAHGLYAVKGAHGVHYSIGGGKSVVLGGVVGHVHGDGELVAAHIGDHDNAHGGNAPHRQHQQADSQPQGQGLDFQAEAQGFLVAVQQLVKQRVLDLFLGAQCGGTRAGHHGQRHDQRGQQAEGDSQRHIGEQFAHHAGGEDHRQKYADGGQGRGDDGTRNLPGTLNRSPRGRYAAPAQTVDVLDDNDRVIHQHADAQRQARQTEDIEGDAGEIHHHDGKQHAQRHRDGDDQRWAQVLQEQCQHQNGQHGAFHQVGQHALDDHADVVALVHDGGQVQAVLAVHQSLHGGGAGGGHG